MFMIEYIWLVPFFPLLGLIINGVLGIRFPKRLIGLIGCATILLSFLLSCLILWELIQLPPESRVSEVLLYKWIPCGELQVNIGFLIDALSLVMLLTVSGVSFIIHVYSIGYMHDDSGYRRYFTYLNLFVFFMLILVSANSFLLMFIGWEGVGLCSYLLIGFWYRNKAPADAGKKAFIVNRVGDYGFLLAMMLIFVLFGTLDFLPVFERASLMFSGGELAVVAITLLLFVGACGKSAQIPLYVWLPDAMEGPTPVSALIHAATMVTAGVYMVARCSILYSLAPVSMGVVAVIGALTAIFTASIAIVTNDIKRVLAYSTISQLGYMFLACGVGAFASGIFHLMTHAFFKALLFLCAGSVMHALAGELDMRKMGSLRLHLPKTYWTFLIACLAIAGIPPFAGFFSKDEILWKAFQGSFFLWAIAAIAAFMTAFYMFRAVFMTFYGESRMEPEVAKHVHESPPVMTIPLIILAILSVFGGFVGVPPIIMKGWNKFHDFLAPVLGGNEAHLVEKSTTGVAFATEVATHGAQGMHHSVGLEWFMMGVSVAIGLAGIITAYYLYLKRPELPERIAQKFKGAHHILYNKYFVDDIYFAIFVTPVNIISTFFWKFFDDKVVDGAMVNGTASLVRRVSGGLKRLQTGYVQHYALSILIGLLFVLYLILKR
jgi:NADH-quinone oxidoreductase subunit L